MNNTTERKWLWFFWVKEDGKQEAFGPFLTKERAEWALRTLRLESTMADRRCTFSGPFARKSAWER